MQRQTPLYLDHHATTPVDPRVLEAMLPFFREHWGNAASKDHRFGNDAKTAVEEARRAIAHELGTRSSEIIFTSGATEANNLAVIGLLGGRVLSDCHAVTTCVEHRAVLDPLIELEAGGLRVTRLRVDEFGRIDPSELEAAICDRTVLVSVMAANNEIGTLQPLGEIGDITRAKGVLLHTDAAQALGHVELNVDALKVDLLSASAHKFYGPKGIGFLYVSRRQPRVELDPIQFGGGHEHGLRSGTLNVPGIVGMATALELAVTLRSAETKRLHDLTDWMFSRLSQDIGSVYRYGHPDLRLPHNLNIGIHGVRAKALVVNLPDLAFSTGSACTTQKAEPSHVLRAIGLPADRLRESIRFGLGRETSRQDVDYALGRIQEVALRIRGSHAVATA